MTHKGISASFGLRHLFRYRQVAKVGIDLVVATLAIVIAYFVRFEHVPPGMYREQMFMVLPVLVGVRIAANGLTGVYSLSWRFFSLRETMHVAVSAVLVTAALAAVRAFAPGGFQLFRIPFGVIAVEGFLALGGMIGVRVVTRLSDEWQRREALLRSTSRPRRRALLVGAGRAGQMALRELRQRPDAGYEVVGFLDDDITRHGQLVSGGRVWGGTVDAAAVAAQVGAEVLILTMPSVAGSQVKEVVDRCQATGLPVHTIPGLYELIGGKVQITKIRPVRIEDLLGREVVLFDPDKWDRVTAQFGGKRVLVTGAGGSIGAELCRQLVRVDPEQLVMLEINETCLFDIDNEIKAQIGERAVPCLADIRDAAQIAEVFDKYQPEVVFHAAAYKHVPMMELHPAAAIDNNVRGTKVVAEAAHDAGVENFVLISTDKAVNPTNVMGASKRVAEMVVQALAAKSETKFACVRFGNVLGSRGSVLHTFQRQIEEGGPVTVTHPEVTRFFMTIPEAVQLVIQAGSIGKDGQILLLDMGEPVKIAEMAAEMIRLAGFTEDEVPIEFVGLRPGEKLFEELLRAGEGVRGSGLERILLARATAVDAVALERDFRRLAKATEASDADAIRAALLAMDVGYRPSGKSTPAEVVRLTAGARVA